MQIKETFNIGTATAMFVYGMLEKMGYNIGGYIIGTVLPQNESEQVFTLTADDIISSIFMVGGILVLFLIVRQHITIRNMKKKKPEQLLDDLIREIRKFRKKWNKGLRGFSIGYRQAILDGDISETKQQKIYAHSISIKRGIVRVKELKIKKSANILDSLTDISNTLTKLVTELEDTTIMTSKSITEVSKQNPELFKNFVERGDKISEDLSEMAYQLGTLRSHIL